MSATRQAAALIEELGAGTVDDILPDMGGLTRKQVLRALCNAATLDLIECDGKKQRAGVHGGVPCTYRAKKAPVQRPRAASVWQYAQQAGA